MIEDDIDWTDASSDFGLAQLCLEMEALAAPAAALVGAAARRRVAPAVKRRAPRPLNRLELA